MRAETVAQVLQPAVRFSLDEIVELPPLIEREIIVPVGNRQKKIYDGAARLCCGAAARRHDHCL